MKWEAKDAEAKRILDEIEKSEELKKLEPMIPLIVTEDLTLAPMNFETPTNTVSNKKKRKQR